MSFLDRLFGVSSEPSTPEKINPPVASTSDSDHINQEMYKKSVELSDRNKTLSILQKIDEIIIGSITHQGEVADAVTNLLVTDAEFQFAAIYLYDEEKNHLTSLAFSQTNANAASDEKQHVHLSDIPLSRTENLIVQSVTEKAVKSAKSFQNVLLNDGQIVLTDSIRSVFVYPLVVRGDLIGAMVIGLAEEEADISLYKRDLLIRVVEIVGIAMDNALLYNRVQAANERLKELDLLKNEFVSVASHELRTPMTAIKSYMWMVLEGRGGEVSEKQKFYLNRAYLSVDRLIKLVNDMLNISRIESGKLNIQIQSIDIRKVTQEVIDEVGPRAQELGVHVSMDAASDLPNVMADSDKIKEVLFNLIGNSLKFTPKDGHITVHLEQKDALVEIKIKDTGAGIPLEDQSKLFQKFGLLPGSYTANQAAMGTGLGLYISKSIVEIHGGTIWMHSEGKDKGSEFVFTLKVYNDKDFQELSAKYHTPDSQKLGIIHTQI